ncbi:S-layer homology domain-containing protein [Intestinibacillus sp. Marseille-P6563]|uniref:S-layer homology domain-containing protein n=1 Tax=Intestinibacillus sp. Marseille-P6563 TaxID=2364792 RepID=UPI000F047FB1|nr:S-layer homology domain-containing protein [Intestinibacillus sp. Marseille-P6563]
MLAFNTHVKKVLALVLAFAMAFTMMATAGAAYTDQADIEATEAVEMLNALGVMTGDPDGSFRPNDTITRAEACRMIYTIRTNSDDASAYANMQTTFKDVPADAWYAGYVKHCQAANIVSGTSATTFEPNRDVTGVELALMCLRVMGYDPAKADIGGSTWSTKTIGLATEAGILDGVNTTITAACPRQWAAQLMYNTIGAPTVQWSTDSNSYSKYFEDGTERDSVGKEYLKLWTNVGTLEKVEDDNLWISQDASDVADSDNEKTSFTKLSQDYTSLLGQKVKVMFRDNKTNSVIGVYALADNASYTVNLKDIEKDGDKVKFDGKSYAFENGKKINVQTVTEDGTFSEDGLTWTSANFDKYATDATDTKVNPATVTFVDSDGNGKLDRAYVTYYKTAEVTYVGSDRIVAGTTYNMDDENIADDIEADDFVAISYNRYDDCRDIVKAEVVTDTLNSSKDKTDYQQFQIGDTWYNIADNKASEVSVGDTVKAYIVAGVIVDIETNDGAALPSNIAVVVGTGSGDTLNGDQVKLRYFDGTLKTVTLSDNTTVPMVEGRAYKVSGSDSNTTLKDVEENQKYNGFSSLVFPTSYTPATVSVSASTIDGKAVADDAAIVVYDKDGRSKVITGKQFNDLSATAPIESNGQAAFVKESGGLNRIRLASIEVTSGKTISDVTGTSNDNYGYIIDGAKVVAGDDIQYTIWNGSGDPIVVKEEGVTVSERQEDMVIGYSGVDADGYIQDVDDDIIDLSAKISTGFNASSDGSNTSKAFVGSNAAAEKSYVSVDNTKLNVTADTKVILVDTSKSGNDMAIPYSYNSTTLTKAASSDKMNVAFILDEAVSNGSADLEMLVVDVNGEFDGWYEDTTGDDTEETPDGTEYADDAALKAALKKGDVVATGVIPAGTYASNSELTLNNAVLDGKVTKTGDVTLAGETQFVSEGALEVTGTLTIKSDAKVDLSKVTAKGAIVDERAETATSDVVALLKNSSDVTVQKATVDNTVTVTGKKLTVVGVLTTGTTLPTATATEISAASVDASAATSVDADALTKLLGWAKAVTVDDVTVGSSVTVDEGKTLVVNGDITSLTNLSGKGNVTYKNVTMTADELKAAPVVTNVAVDKFEVGAKVVLTFSKPLDKTTAETTSNYTFADGTSQPTVASAELSEDGKTVTITTATNAIEGSATTLTVGTSVKDFADVVFTTTNAKVSFGATYDAEHTIGNA